MKKINFFIVIFLFATLTHAQSSSTENYNPAREQNNLKMGNLTKVGVFPYGCSQSVAADSINDIIFLGSGGAVLILDGSDKTNPILLSDTIRTYGYVRDIFYDLPTKRLYLACDEGGYEIWNVEDPLNPFLYGRYEIYFADVEVPVWHVQVTGHFAVFECSWGFIHVVDASNPYNPVQTGFSSLVGNPAKNLHIDEAGRVHAIGQWYYVIYSIDEAGQLNTEGSYYISDSYTIFGKTDISYLGVADYLYIITGNGYSVTNVGGIRHIEVRGNIAYIINAYGLHTWDVSDSENPFMLGSIGMETYPEDLYVGGNFAYISLYDYGLRIFDISNPQNLVLMGEYDTFGRTNDVFVKGSYAYLAHDEEGMSIIDLSNIDYPVFVDSVGLPGRTLKLDIKDNLAFTSGTMGGGLSIIDISDPENPSLLANAGGFNGSVLKVADTLIFVEEIISTNNTFLKIFNISDLYNPVEINTIQFPQLIDGLDYQDGYLFVPANDEGLFIYDVTNPLDPVLVNNIFHVQTTDVSVHDTILYLISSVWPSYDGGIHIYDISDLTTPVHLGSYAESGFFPYEIAVKDEYLYVDDIDKIWFFEVEDNNPQLIEKYQMPYLVADLYASGRYLYVAEMNAGLYILQNDLIAIPVELESFTANAEGNSVRINWRTGSELNNARFEIERKEPSKNKSSWIFISSVEGSGTTTNPQEYYFLDKDLDAGIYDYRLKQIDLDGSYRYSDVAEVSINKPLTFSLSQNYPNPFNPSTTIKYSIPHDEFVSLEVYDILGNEVEILVSEKQKKGEYDVLFNGDNIASGIYIYRLIAGNFVALRKFVLIK